MTEEQHKWLFLTVRDLDAVLPSPEAAVQITSEDADFHILTATQEGYLRLGVEMLKAAILTPGEKEEDGVLRLGFDLSRLMAPGNEVEIDTFLMVDAIAPLPEPEPYVAPSSAFVRPKYSRSLFVIGLICVALLALLMGMRREPSAWLAA
jgi:hypothetical protein